MEWRELWMARLCPGCNEALPQEGLFCASCRAELREPPPSHCPLCMRPNPYPLQPCALCRASPPPFESVYAPFVYEGPMAWAVQRFKYHGQAELALPLAQLWKQKLGRVLNTLPNNIVPIPLHRQRYVERGFEQTVLLSKALAKLSGKTLRLHWLKRTKATPKQVGHGQTLRQHNLESLEKAFSASPAANQQSLLLVDDVLTTGSTASACARTLKKAGAQAIHILCLCRTVFDEK